MNSMYSWILYIYIYPFEKRNAYTILIQTQYIPEIKTSPHIMAFVLNIKSDKGGQKNKINAWFKLSRHPRAQPNCGRAICNCLYRIHMSAIFPRTIRRRFYIPQGLPNRTITVEATPKCNLQTRLLFRILPLASV
jgi:hypothetical protein